jgi:hypothetical protein
MQDDKTTNLKLAGLESTASFFWNIQISSEYLSSNHSDSRYKCGGNVGPTSIYRLFLQTSKHHSGSSGFPFFDPSSATGSTSHHLHQDSPRAIFYPYPSGSHFFLTPSRYTCSCSKLSNKCLYVRFSSDIVHVG